MDRLLQRYHHPNYSDTIIKKEPVRSVLHISQQHEEKDDGKQQQQCEYNVCKIMTRQHHYSHQAAASKIPRDVPDPIRTDSSSSDLNNFSGSDSFSTSPVTTRAREKDSLKQSIAFCHDNGYSSHQEHKEASQNSESDWNHQAEYFCDGQSASVRPSPASDHIATPPPAIGQASTNDPSVLTLPPATALIQSPTSVSTDGSSLTHQHHPQLYSAIGSLEDPTTNSLSRWNQEHTATKYEFPSNTLLKPMNAHRKKESDIGWQRTTTRGKNKAAHATRRLDASSTTTMAKVAPIATALKKTLPPGRSDSLSATVAPRKKPSNLKKSKDPDDNSTTADINKSKTSKHVTISEQAPAAGKRTRHKSKKGPLEMFRPSSDAYTPRMGKKEIKYKPAEMRTPVQTLATSLGTLQRPNFRDALRRVAMILRQHIVKIEQRFENKTAESSTDILFDEEMKNVFSEERFASSKYKCTMVRVPMARGGMVYGLKQMRRKFEIPSEGEIYEFAHQLFNSVQLSSECSIVCLIYVERLMEASKVPLLANTWRPIFMCGLLLASKVWQDLSSWNIEFASVYPQYSLDAINRLEILFLRMIKWDLYISSSCYAKYYFALRSLVEKPDFRQRYNRMVGLDSVQASEALKIERRSTQVKEEAILQLSRSM